VAFSNIVLIKMTNNLEVTFLKKTKQNNICLIHTWHCLMYTLGPFFVFTYLHIMEVNGVHQLFVCPYSSKYLLLCSAEDRNS